MTHIVTKKIGNNYYEYEQSCERGADGKPHSHHIRYIGRAGTMDASAPRGSQTPMTEREREHKLKLINSTLQNDVSSSNKEMEDYFVKETGMSHEEAKYYVSKRQEAQNDFKFKVTPYKQRESVKSELQKGIKVESEHKKTIATIRDKKLTIKQAERKIAQDHLKEDPHYYDKLAKIESKKKVTPKKHHSVVIGNDEVTPKYKEHRLAKETPKTRAEAKFKVVMHEYGRGKLKSSSGQKVTNKKQAEAIAFSEARKKYASYGK